MLTESELNALLSRPHLAPLLLACLALLLAVRLLDGRRVPDFFRIFLIFNVPIVLAMFVVYAAWYPVSVFLLALGILLLVADEFVYMFGPMLNPITLAKDVVDIIGFIKNPALSKKK